MLRPYYCSGGLLFFPAVRWFPGSLFFRVHRFPLIRDSRRTAPSFA